MGRERRSCRSECVIAMNLKHRSFQTNSLTNCIHYDDLVICSYGPRSTWCSSPELPMPKHTHGMAPDPAGVASRSRLVVVMSSPHKTSMLVSMCATTPYRSRHHAYQGRGMVVPRTTYSALRMHASPAFPSSSDETMGFNTSVDTTSDMPRHRSLRINVSPGFWGSTL